MQFQHRDVGADPDALEELRALQLQVVPVTLVDGQVIVGFNRPALTKALGLGRGPGEAQQGRLAAGEADEGPQWMARKFEVVLSAALRATRQIPDEMIDWVSPERGRVLRQFTFHLFDRPNIMLDAHAKGAYRAEDRGRYINDALQRRDVADIADFGESVIARLREFFATARPETLEEVVETYMGPMSLQQLLDLGLGHSAHHLKQLYLFMGQIGITPEAPLSQEDFDGVAVPSELF